MLLPKNIVTELTYNCNHRCLFCYCPWENDSGYKQQELNTQQWLRCFEVLKANGAQQITLSGGEPLLREDLFELITYLKKLQFRLAIISNGLLIDEAFLDKIAPLGVLLEISVPGIKTYAQTTGVDNVVHTLELFKKARQRKIHTSANITVSKINLPELYENIAYPIIYGADYLLLNRFMPGGRGMKNRDLLLSKSELNQMMEIAESVLSKAGRKGHVGTELPYCTIENYEKYKYLGVSCKCSAAKYFCSIDPSGYIKVCNHSPHRICRYTEITTRLYNDPYWNKFLQSDYIPAICNDCPDLSRCDGGCREAAHVSNGSPSGPDPLLEISLLDGSDSAR